MNVTNDKKATLKAPENVSNQIDLLQNLGVGRIFTPGSSLDEIPIWLTKEISNDRL
jgi:hypothetical protein